MRRIKESWDKLTKDAIKAENLGMSYGKMKGLEYEKEQQVETLAEERRRKAAENRKKLGRCCVCGEKVYGSSMGNGSRYCSIGCRVQAEEAMENGEDLREKQVRAEKPVRRCVRCGKTLGPRKRRYCSQFCRELVLGKVQPMHEATEEEREQGRIKREMLAKKADGRHCIVCKKELEGRQTVYCGRECKRIAYAKGFEVVREEIEIDDED